VIAAKNTKRSGHQPSSKTDLLKELVPENRKITICEVANMLGINLNSSEHSERQLRCVVVLHQMCALPTW